MPTMVPASTPLSSWARASVDASLIARLKQAGINHHFDACIGAVGGKSVESVDILRRDGKLIVRVACDLLASSGGWSPTVHLYSQGGGKLRFDETIAAFVPNTISAAITAVGAANGEFSLAGALLQGSAAGAEAASLAGRTAPVAIGVTPSCEPETISRIEPMWQTPRNVSRGKQFVDIQDDVTVDDIELAYRENFRSVEHLKRYTTLGMGTDQGKTSNVNGLAIMASLRGESIPAVGTTTYRAPYTPVALGLFAGDVRALLFVMLLVWLMWVRWARSTSKDLTHLNSCNVFIAIILPIWRWGGCATV